MAVLTTKTYTCSDGTQYADQSNAEQHEAQWQAEQDRVARIMAWVPTVDQFCDEVLQEEVSTAGRSRVRNAAMRLIEWLLDRGYTIEVVAEK